MANLRFLDFDAITVTCKDKEIWSAIFGIVLERKIAALLCMVSILHRNRFPKPVSIFGETAPMRPIFAKVPAIFIAHFACFTASLITICTLSLLCSWAAPRLHLITLAPNTTLGDRANN